MKITRILSEIESIESTFYKPTSDLGDRAFLLELRRKNAIRSTVLELHTAIEELMTEWLKATLLGQQLKIEERRIRRSARSCLLDQLLDGEGSIGFERKLKLMRVVGLIAKGTHEKLAVLNTLRNKCSHTWELDQPVRKGKRPRQLKPPLLQFRGKSLFEMATFRGFVAEYGQFYYDLFLRVYD